MQSPDPLDLLDAAALLALFVLYTLDSARFM